MGIPVSANNTKLSEIMDSPGARASAAQAEGRSNYWKAFFGGEYSVMDPDAQAGHEHGQKAGLAADAAAVAYPFLRAFNWVKGMLVADAVIANPIPEAFARVIPQGLNPTTLAKSGDTDVFVTNAAALRNFQMLKSLKN